MKNDRLLKHTADCKKARYVQTAYLRLFIESTLSFLLISTLLTTFCDAEETFSQEELDKWEFSRKQVEKCGVSDMVANNDCISRELKVSNTELNRIYGLLKSELINPKLLKQSQLAWIQFRDKSCSYELSGLTGNGTLPLNGSIAVFQETACLINLTEKRILDLKTYYSWTYDGSPPRKH